MMHNATTERIVVAFNIVMVVVIKFEAIQPQTLTRSYYLMFANKWFLTPH